MRPSVVYRTASLSHRSQAIFRFLLCALLFAAAVKHLKVPHVDSVLRDLPRILLFSERILRVHPSADIFTALCRLFSQFILCSCADAPSPYVSDTSGAPKHCYDVTI